MPTNETVLPAAHALARLEADGADRRTIEVLRTILATFPTARVRHRQLDAGPVE